MNAAAPDNPAGLHEPESAYDDSVRESLTRGIATAPNELRKAVAGLDDSQLDTRYRNWTIRQITHHIADSHIHSYIRFKWALTEDNPLIKAYEEADWVKTDDSAAGDVEPSLLLLEGLHSKWVQVLESMKPAHFEKTFRHPQSGETVSLWTALNYYPWHCKHHTAQILWLRDQNGW